MRRLSESCRAARIRSGGLHPSPANGGWPRKAAGWGSLGGGSPTRRAQGGAPLSPASGGGRELVAWLANHSGAVVVAALLAVAFSTAAVAADPRNPDWPCVQVKVPEISLAAVWAGPPLDDVGTAWQQDQKVKEMVDRLAARRVPLEEAQKLAADFLREAGDRRLEAGKLLFAGLFDTLNRLRSEIIVGIERYTRRQREVAQRIRNDTLKLRELQDAPKADQKQVDDLSQQLEWQTRIFDDRRGSISAVCEVPVLIERRLFALGRTIQEGME
jgi:hypothetical protein